jgi:hypothetical protein
MLATGKIAGYMATTVQRLHRLQRGSCHEGGAGNGNCQSLMTHENAEYSVRQTIFARSLAPRVYTMRHPCSRQEQVGLTRSLAD